MSPYIPRYTGPRWSIYFGEYAGGAANGGAANGVEKFALEELYRAVQRFLPYVVEVRPASQVETLTEAEHVILLGTPHNNRWIRQLVDSRALRLPRHAEGFAAACCPSPWNPAHRVLALAGNRPPGVLYAVETLNARVLAGLAEPDASPEALRRAFDALVDFRIEDYPRVEERGIWTWGYVIYDYRRFLDHMARLRLNSLTIWNDTPPLNAPDVIDYAHSRGIRIILGFPWGWGKDYDLASPAGRQAIEEEVVRHYQEQIAPLHPDGIYFQTLTEHDQTELGGRPVAEIACELVNQVSARLLALNPRLVIQFGLHATSIQDHYPAFAALDPRVDIIWEDAGALPYTYTPALEYQGRNVEETLAYSRALAAIRPGAAFGLVPKGWTNLDWANEFEHHPPYLLGTRAPEFIRRRMAQRQARWDEVNTLWLAYFPHATAFYRSLVELTGGHMIVQALVEDGLLEAQIPISVALYAETLWDPCRPDEEILERAKQQVWRLW